MKKIFNLTQVTWVLLVIAILTLAGCGNGNPSQSPKYRFFGPASLNIGAGSGDFEINSLKLNDRVEFNFTVSGAPVSYSVQDSKGNTILIGRGAYRYLQRGRGRFIASTAGDYKILFVSSGLGNPSVVTIDYTIYFFQ